MRILDLLEKLSALMYNAISSWPSLTMLLLTSTLIPKEREY